MVKDCKEVKLAECLQATNNLVKLIEAILTPQNTSLVHMAASGAGQPKKGMPGHTQFYQQAELNIALVIRILLKVLETYPADDFKTANQVCGLAPNHYSQVLKQIKHDLIERILPALLFNFKEMTMPFLHELKVCLGNYMRETCIRC